MPQSITNLKQQSGSVAIETIFLLPIIVILLFAVIHYCMIFFAASMFDHVAKESIRQSMAFVNEECYFSYKNCSGAEVLTEVTPTIRTHAKIIIQGFTQGQGESLGSLFGVTLPDPEELIRISTITDPIDGSDICCQVTIVLDEYRTTPFLPTNIIDGLLPKEVSVFPDQIVGTAVLKLN
ncbi:MAG: TadE family protein [Vibrio toranzoniae]|mgnify:CR=1 FL=1|jgi:hypothetical protein|uniref:TadE family protein n=1 Tax=Vibrio toranzoniae TaxID=1194427 RepID=UPI00137820D5|nr:TadE family protein [Vibrio toranzoniae]NAZ54002.1 pilus assembly protein [Vibrio toranzoniae]NAZ98361.1 pilus assembly protein [Vibrio toranzoniae]